MNNRGYAVDIKDKAAAEASVKFIMSAFYSLHDRVESRSFVKELIFDHMVQFPRHPSSRALLSSIRAHVRRSQKLNTWMAPPLVVYTNEPTVEKQPCGLH